MGQSEALTALALGRGHYEDEVVWNSEVDKANNQRYNSRGHPKHPETKKRERDHIRAANEVMQVTGIVEDTAAARVKSNLDEADKQLESFIGFRLIEFGRAFLHTGVWPIIGLRRRILLYRPYTALSVVEILSQERKSNSIPHILFSGLPMALIPHTSDYFVLIVETFLEYIHWPSANGRSSNLLSRNLVVQGIVELGFRFFKIQFTLFSTLQQLGLIPESRLFPSLISLIPFTTSSLIQIKPKTSSTFWMQSSSMLWALFQVAAPLLVIRSYETIQLAVSSVIYRKIYTGLPRPTGSGLLSGLPLGSPTVENESTDYVVSSTWNSLPSAPWTTISSDSDVPAQNTGRDGSDEEDDEMNHAQLISFDVEPTESSEITRGPWSAELRNANESKTSATPHYRVTGLTLLPNILATELLTDIVSDIFLLPFEAFMVRVVGTAYHVRAGVGSNYQYKIGLRPRGLVNLLVAWTLQVTVTGVIWAGFTMCTNWYITQRQRLKHNIHTRTGEFES